MIDGEQGCDGVVAAGSPWRRAREVFDDYDGGGVISEQLADDLVNDLAGMGGTGGMAPRPRTARPRRGPTIPGRPGPQPSRPNTSSPRPRLALVRAES